MFNERGYLVCSVVGESDGQTHLEAVMFDGTPFNFIMPTNQIILGDDLNAFVRVEKLGVALETVSIQLPAPSLHYGHNVVVKSSSVLKITQISVSGA
jgi:hypothetical protein